MSEDECRCKGELKPRPAARAPCRLFLALGRRRRLDWARFRRRDFENSLTAYHTHINNQHKVTFRPPHRKKKACPQLSNPAHTWRKGPICKQLSVVLSIPSGIPHIFLAILVDGQVDGAEGAAADLLLDQVLVDAVLGGAVILAVAVLGARVERFLLRHQRHVRAELLTYVLFNLCFIFLSQFASHLQFHECVLGRVVLVLRTLTCLVVDAARRWCRRGLW